MNKLIKEVREEVKKRLELSSRSLFGTDWVAIHKNTVKHILKIIKEKERV